MAIKLVMGKYYDRLDWVLPGNSLVIWLSLIHGYKDDAVY